MSKKNRKWSAWGAAVAALAVVGGVLFAGAPAQAAGFCYESGTITNSKSLNFYDVVIHESLTYKPVYDCSGVRIGVHVIGVSASYTGGSASTTAGINQIGVLMQQVGGTACGPVGPYRNSVSPAKRSVSATANTVVYNGTFKNCFGASYGFDQTCTYMRLNQAFHIGNIAFSGTFRSCLNSGSISPIVET